MGKKLLRCSEPQTLQNLSGAYVSICVPTHQMTMTPNLGVASGLNDGIQKSSGVVVCTSDAGL